MYILKIWNHTAYYFQFHLERLPIDSIIDSYFELYFNEVEKVYD